MGIAILCLIAVSAAVGYQAQATKGRTGAAWAVSTFILLFILFSMFWPDSQSFATLDRETRRGSLELVDKLGQGGYAASIAILFGWPLMAIIVATLPKRKND